MPKPILRVNNLSMKFGGIKALKSIHFDVMPQGITALIGPNGAGKTTLFNCLTGFYRATHGNLTFYNESGEHDIKQILGESFLMRHVIHPMELFSCLYYKMFGGPHQVAKLGIARTFQNIRLFREMTVVENLLVAQHRFANANLISGLFNLDSFQKCEQYALNNAYEWLDIFHLSEDANRLAGKLPYGKQRHLEIARAMCTQPSLLCLDEPAAGLNPHETSDLCRIILKLREKFKITILLIEHDMSMVMSISDHIIVLDHGEVIADGTPAVIAHDKKVIEAYLGIS